jgi:cobalamin biosynthesis Mg chelatase CobN
MQKTHQNPARKGFGALGLLSVVALLAFLCFPALALADSGEIQYEEVTPTVTGEKNPPTHHEPTAHPSNVTGGAQAPGSEASNSGSPKAEPSTGGQTPATVNATGDGQGSRGHDSTGAKKQPGQDQSPGASKTAAQSDDGGSSPRIPILIAILVLAGISIGVVIMRAKRQQGGPGASVSPKAS